GRFDHDDGRRGITQQNRDGVDQLVTTPSSEMRPNRTRRALTAPILRSCAAAIAEIASPASNAVRSRLSSSALQESPCLLGSPLASFRVIRASCLSATAAR